MSLPEIHARLGNTALYFVLALGAWGLWRYIRKQGLDSSYWGALIIGEIILLVQGSLGAYLWLNGLRPGRGIHILYGIVAAMIIPGIYAYTRGDEDRRVMLIYGVALLIAVAIILRAMMTAVAG
jgi:hypothetical protein